MKKTILFLLALSIYTGAFAQCSDLFFSVYFEGANNDKALELYNPTNSPINLSGYHVDRYSNGSTTPVETFNLSGTIGAYGTFVVVNGQTDSQFVSTPAPGYWSVPINDSIKQTANQLADTSYPSVFYFNGNDALTLSKNSQIVDIFGKIGQDPGKDWSWDPTTNPPYTNPVGGLASQDLTYHFALVRKASVKQGVTVNPLNFNGLAEYDSIYYKRFKYSTGFHNHTCDCKVTGINEVAENDVNLVVFPNPVDNRYFFVQADENLTDVTVFDLIGNKLIQLQTSRANKTQVDAGNLAAGCYLVNVKTQSGASVTRKLVIQ